jgi:hypothetical protein
MFEQELKSQAYTSAVEVDEYNDDNSVHVCNLPYKMRFFFPNPLFLQGEETGPLEGNLEFLQPSHTLEIQDAPSVSTARISVR